ncbi:unnamed protein product [Orchesella dallaii]|uniref:Uncharacterized protein n=1 Tax=Orchesella dallaii TaxID=48710 RepID=A0ABP1QN13_9HEXA
MDLRHFTVLLLVAVNLCAAQVCNNYCDGRDPSQAINLREAVSVQIFGRTIRLYVSDSDNMGWADISEGNPGDEVWIDRSFNAGIEWEGRLGLTAIPSGMRNWRTQMFNVDNPSQRQIGALRACGKAGDREEIACTSWARSTVNAENRVDAGATALMQFYDGKLFTSTGWWNGANCLTALLDYFKVTGSQTYRHVIDEIFERNKDEHFGNFLNDYIDDVLWWGLAWVNAYDLTGQTKYLDMAKINSDYGWSFKDNHCGGGLWWSTDKDYKNAIPNELFIKLAAALHNRIPGDTKFLSQSIEVWNWFKNSGMINQENLINDGLTDDCQNNGRIAWSYNQGVILGGLLELHKATNDQSYIDEAKKIVEAVFQSNQLTPNGILTDYGCEPGDCGGDVPTFKGVFVRNLGELNRFLPDRPYTTWLQNQANSIWDNNRNSLNQFGLRWAGPLDKVGAARHQSAFEAFVAAV